MEVKNYNQPVDASLFPEGCPRCSLLKFLLHLVPVAAVGLWGAYAAFRVLAHGLGETGLDDYFGFGLWITFDLAVIALGAGAFFTGALRYLLNIDALKNIINLTVVVGFLCYSGAMLVLVLDIGQPLRAWFGYWHPNVHSMLTEVIFCITCYCTVLIIEYVPLALENRQLAKNRLAHAIAHNFHLIMPLFAGIGAFLSTFHQGSLGGMYGVLFGRPYILRDGFFIWPWTFFLYILSAVGSGPMFTVLVCTFMEKLTGPQARLLGREAAHGQNRRRRCSPSTWCSSWPDTAGWVMDILPRSGHDLRSDVPRHGSTANGCSAPSSLVIAASCPSYLLLLEEVPLQPGRCSTLWRHPRLRRRDHQPLRHDRSGPRHPGHALRHVGISTYPNWAEWGACLHGHSPTRGYCPCHLLPLPVPCSRRNVS